MDVLYLDDNVIVINKPSGLLTIPDGYDSTLACAKFLLEEKYGKCFIVHRLDKETSGTLIVARDAFSHRNLNLQFQDHSIQKTYHAIVHGHFTAEAMAINSPLRVNADRKHRTLVDPSKGKAAMTDVLPLQVFINYSLIQANPETGYTHQIRSHLASIGHPIVNDLLYQQGTLPDASLITCIQRVALHALKITFMHPTTSQIISIVAEYPSDFQNALKQLQK